MNVLVHWAGGRLDVVARIKFNTGIARGVSETPLI